MYNELLMDCEQELLPWLRCSNQDTVCVAHAIERLGSVTKGRA
jgi:hypothetical protein